MENNHLFNAYLLAECLFLICFLSLFLSQINFFFFGVMNSMVFPLSIVMSFFIIFICRYCISHNTEYLHMGSKGSSLKKYFPFIMLIVETIGIICISILISLFFWDGSWDGNWYHKNTLLALHNGWNPIYSYQSHHDMICEGWPKEWSNMPNWTDIHCKGAETIQATIYSLTNFVETAKAYNYILTISTFLFIYDALYIFKPGMKKNIRCIYSILLVGCPIVIAQINTFYIDFLGYLFFMIVGANCYRLLKKGKSSIIHSEYFLIGMSISLAVATKMNIAFWICMEILLFGVFVLIKKQTHLIINGGGISFLGFSIGFFFFAFNPYIHNVKNGHNLFYPFLGEKKYDYVFDAQVPPAIKNHNVFYKAGYSFLWADYKRIKGQWRQGINLMGVSDARQSGCGFFFFDSILLALLLFALSIKTRQKLYYIMLSLGLIVGIFILENGWWGRYYPYIYVLPFLFLLYNEKFGSKYKNVKYLKILLVSFLTINCSLSLIQCLKNEHYQHMIRLEMLSHIRQVYPVHLAVKHDVGFYILLKEQKVPYIPCDTANYSIPSTCAGVFAIKEEWNKITPQKCLLDY